MNRFMVWVGFESLLISLTAVATSRVSAEMPHYLPPSDAPAPSLVWHETISAGWKESRRRNVPMVIYITSEQCAYCEAMKRDTWREKTIRDRLAAGFVTIRLSPRRNSTTLNRIDVQTYPMTLVGVPEGKIIGHRIGYQPPAALHGLLTEAKSKRLRPQ